MKPANRPSMPSPDPDTRTFFAQVLDDDPRIEVRPMFGHVAAFAGGQMFSGVFGKQVFVRLDEAGREELLRWPGAALFEPMKGRPMREYVVLPPDWRGAPSMARSWAKRALEYVVGLPPKGKGKAKGKGKPKAKPKATADSRTKAKAKTKAKRRRRD